MPRGIGQLTSLENLSAFMVAKDNGVSKHSGRLGELRDLNNLRGNLRIMNLRYVKNPASEFKAANLKEKQYLQTFRLSWKLGPPYDNNCDSGPDEVENDEEMSLEELQPHLNLKWFLVFGRGRLLFPSWISSLNNLVVLRIDNCKKCQHFPPLDQFPSLKRLTIENLTDLEYIESGINCDNALFFPSLENLWLENCPNLKGWRRDTSTPQLLQFHCLDYLEIRGVDDKSHITPTSLYSVLSKNNKGVFCFATSNPLEKLVFLACEELDLSDSEDHSDMPWQYLTRLQVLIFENLFKLASLPKGLQHVHTLRTLAIKSCPNLISLPEWMESLTALQYLWIEECPQLSERCQNNMGADWPKIAHTPNISIDGRWIQKDCCYKL
ncbi:hypothetical protein GH714_016413 [Hevea brasiliensis]|uniref:R13L1/DRL21-like LRR repeat region domain-containing protein n=1 Tax=Hevea brasiliensis TaxID=3981 RepID=A0A6A6N2D1_HEVBR|nr:hypothetical protein GH714_016413 [Hevea brasiliensis]